MIHKCTHRFITPVSYTHLDVYKRQVQYVWLHCSISCLPVPNLTTSDVYYRRQLSFYNFNIHTLSNGDSNFYTYSEVHGKKGSDDVSSILFDFIMNHLPPQILELTIFCNSCCGQNKNFTVFRMLHFVVHTVKRLKEIKVMFPIRGHSYLDLSLIHI